MESYFKNWCKYIGRAKKKEISEIFPVYVSGYENNISIKFEQPKGLKIEFNLNPEHSELFLKQVSRLKPKV